MKAIVRNGRGVEIGSIELVGGWYVAMAVEFANSRMVVIGEYARSADARVAILTSPHVVGW